MTKGERAELRRLAEAAAHVEWWKAVDKIQDRAGLHESADAFIGAANPANVLSLLDELEAEPKWISCSERMPELGVYVLATDGEIVSEARYVRTCWEDGNEDDVQLDDLTHWMPLPAPPKAAT